MAGPLPPGEQTLGALIVVHLFIEVVALKHSLHYQHALSLSLDTVDKGRRQPVSLHILRGMSNFTTPLCLKLKFLLFHHRHRLLFLSSVSLSVPFIS